ncbi:hypothetical protein M3Y97_00028900 [Aphelenchoides bicaudatus]|nr:hypothetical protein M3Y97_00028900 [Aphelenchoides bicaudatus]
MIRNAAKVAGLCEKIAEQVDSKRMSRLFAVIHLQARQFRVVEGDIIHIEHNVELKFGDRIKLEKVLAVGNANFTLLGRPTLSKDLVSVNATVIEKTTTSPDVQYLKVSGKQIENLKWLSRELTVLRINQIQVDSKHLQ